MSSMISIKNIDKIIGMDFYSDRNFHYVVDRIEEHQNFYVFIIRNLETALKSIISLNRHSKTEFRGEQTYELLWNGIDSRISVTAAYIEDIKEMIKSIKSVVDNNNF